MKSMKSRRETYVALLESFVVYDSIHSEVGERNMIFSAVSQTYSDDHVFVVRSLMMFLRVERCRDLHDGFYTNTLFKITSHYYRELFGKLEH